MELLVTVFLLCLLIPVLGVGIHRLLRGTPFEGRRFGCGAGYQPKKRDTG